MNKYVLSTDAEHDLDAIWEYIARDSIDAADRWIDTLFNGFATLASTPHIGDARRDLTMLPVLFLANQSLHHHLPSQ
jgi:plasmid stabilization system protein ParE